ncbi:hypothetical protein F4821DRAFT_251577 [Hypoxylon rubiginosum]|uniref:Uncharacterized protein n=1 Tax=Hypoxylon rubiginosum TaxID=110542 RepID=A0ACC0CJ72_9PEZI|nr:hypothetical protein F4821DRAFT_251577 [Hypoxylon rubiginosum]
MWPLLLVAVTSSLASRFRYASLAHINYIKFLLAKSCKLLPVMSCFCPSPCSAGATRCIGIWWWRP